MSDMSDVSRVFSTSSQSSVGSVGSSQTISTPQRLLQTISKIASYVFNLVLSPFFALTSVYSSWVENKRRENVASQWEDKLKLDGLQLKDAEDWIKREEHLVRIAIVQNPEAISHADNEICLNQDFLINTIDGNRHAWEGYFPYNLIPSEVDRNEFIKKVLERNSSWYSGLNEEDRSNKDFALQAVKASSDLWSSVPESLRSDSEIQEVRRTVKDNESL